MKYSLYSKFSYRKVYSPTPYLHLALGHRWPWDQVGGARVGRGTVALRCLGCLPTITSSISGVKDAQRSRRQSIWAVYTSLRHTAKYTGFGCISYTYSLLALSRLACQDIQHIQPIQPIQPYSHTRHTSYSAIQPPSGWRRSQCASAPEPRSASLLALGWTRWVVRTSPGHQKCAKAPVGKSWHRSARHRPPRVRQEC